MGRTGGRGHLSLRPQYSTLARLERRARHAAQPKTTLAERYLKEGLEMDEFRGIYFVDGALGRRPALLGTGLDVWEVIETLHENDSSIPTAAGYLEIDPGIVEAAVRYYGSHREEINKWIARVREIAEEEESKWLKAQEALE